MVARRHCGAVRQKRRLFVRHCIRVDHRPVEADRIRKSVGDENTFEQDLLQWKIWNACERGGHSGRTVTVKVVEWSKEAADGPIDPDRAKLAATTLSWLLSSGRPEACERGPLRFNFKSPHFCRLGYNCMVTSYRCLTAGRREMPWQHALDLTKPTTKRSGVPTAVVRTSKRVQPNILRMIQVGDQVIRETQGLVPHGAGNQTHATFNDPETEHRTLAAQKAYTQLGGGFFPSGKPQIIAGATIAFQAGACQDQAAVAYLLLREQLDNRYFVAYGYAPNKHHSFCLVKETGSIGSPSEVVVVDSWSKYPQALVWEDHWCCPEFVLYSGKPGKGVPGKVNKALAKFTSNPQAFAEVATMTAGLKWQGTVYHHQWGSRNGSIICYNNDDVVMSDA